MRSKNITVLIRTIGRPSLRSSIKSALSEFENVIVIADAIDLTGVSDFKEVTFLKTGRKFDKYGSACINMGAYATKTDWFCLLDDDDEFEIGSGEFMEQKVKSNLEVGVWIPGIQFNNGKVLCKEKGLGVFPGNIAVPTYKTELLFLNPFTLSLTLSAPDYTDFQHVRSLYELGVKVDWYGKVLYKVRPRLEGTNGRGSL